MLTAAAAAFGMSMGTVMGSTRRGPFSLRVSHASSSLQSPPMPVEYSTPRRSGSTSGEPASAQASREAMSANWLIGSSRLISWRSSTSSGRTFASAAKVTGSSSSLTQSWMSVAAPDSPASRAFQVSGAVPPSGDDVPMPVTTIFLVIRILRGVVNGCRKPAGRERAEAIGASARYRSVLRVDDVGDGVADGLEVLDLFVGDLHVELLLGVHDDGHHRDRVDVEVVGEGLVELDGVRRDTGLIVDELGQAGEDFFGG